MIYSAGEGNLDFSNSKFNLTGSLKVETKQGKVDVSNSNISAWSEVSLIGAAGVSGDNLSSYSGSNTTIESSKGKVNLQGANLRSSGNTKIHGTQGVDLSSTDKSKTYVNSSSNISITSKNDIDGKNVYLSGKNVDILSETGDVDLGYRKHYIGRRPEFNVSSIRSDNLRIEGRKVNISAANIEAKQGGVIHADQDVTADSVIETYVARSWSRSSWFGFCKSSGYEEEAVMAITSIKTQGKFQIISDKGGVSAKGMQVVNDKQEQATDVEIIAEKDINLDSVEKRVHYSSSSSSFWGLNSKSRSGYNTQGNQVTILANDNIKLHSKSGKIQGKGVDLVSSNIEVHAKKDIDFKPYELESYCVTKESGFSFGFGNPPNLFNNGMQLVQRVSSIAKAEDGPTGVVCDVVGAVAAGYNTVVGAAKLALSNASTLKKELLSCFSPSIGFYSHETRQYQKQQVLGNIKCNTLSIKSEEGIASFASNIQARKTIIDTKEIVFNNAQHQSQTSQSSTSFGIKLGLGSLLAGDGLPITISGSHQESQGSSLSNQQASISLGDTHFVKNETVMRNKGNNVNMERTTGGRVKIIDEDMQDDSKFKSQGANFSISFSANDISDVTVGANFANHEHRTTKQAAKTTINDKRNEVSIEHVTKQDHHKDVSVDVSISPMALFSKGPEISMPVRASVQVDDFKFRVEVPNLNMGEKIETGTKIINNAANWVAGNYQAPNSKFEFSTSELADMAETELRTMLMNGEDYEECLNIIQYKYQVPEIQQQLLKENVENNEQKIEKYMHTRKEDRKDEKKEPEEVSLVTNPEVIEALDGLAANLNEGKPNSKEENVTITTKELGNLIAPSIVKLLRDKSGLTNYVSTTVKKGNQVLYVKISKIVDPSKIDKLQKVAKVSVSFFSNVASNKIGSEIAKEFVSQVRTKEYYEQMVEWALPQEMVDWKNSVEAVYHLITGGEMQDGTKLDKGFLGNCRTMLKNTSEETAMTALSPLSYIITAGTLAAGFNPVGLTAMGISVGAQLIENMNVKAILWNKPIGDEITKQYKSQTNGDLNPLVLQQIMKYDDTYNFFSNEDYDEFNQCGTGIYNGIGYLKRKTIEGYNIAKQAAHESYERSIKETTSKLENINKKMDDTNLAPWERNELENNALDL